MTQETVNSRIRVPKQLWDEVRKAALLRSVPTGSIVVSAIRDKFNKTSSLDEKGISARLGRIERSIKELRSDIEIMLEVLFHFIFHWFCYTPPLPSDDKDALVADAEARFEHFVSLLRKRFDQGEFRTSGVLRGKEPPAEGGHKAANE